MSAWDRRGLLHLALVGTTTLGPLPGEIHAQWVEEPRSGWVDLTVYHLDTRENFEFDGDVRNFFADGHAISTSVFLTLAAGILPGVDGWVQVPYHRLRYNDARDNRLRTGIGDSNLHLRVAPLHYLGSVLPLAIRAGVKLPVGDFAVDSEVIPLGDGQTDWEVMAELGHSLYPVPAYLSGWVGYRWRRNNGEAQRDFGDEGFFLAQAGGTYRAIGLQLIVEGTKSVTTPVFERVRIPSAERSILQLTPRVSLEAAGGAFNLGARIPVAGKNLPAGTSLVAGYFTRWSL